MRVGVPKEVMFPKSSFLAVDKDMALICDKILQNQRLLKLLYYTQPDCLKAPDLTDEQKMSLINNQLRIVPYLNIEEKCPIVIFITMDDFITNSNNPQFRDCTIQFQILCHPNHWNLGNFALRPYKIAGELDAMFNEQRLTGIGLVNFMGCTDLVLNDNLMGLNLIYTAIHGVEDKIEPLSR